MKHGELEAKTWIKSQDLDKVIPIGFPLWGHHIIKKTLWFLTVKQQQISILKQNKMNIYFTASIKGAKRIDASTMAPNIGCFFKPPKSSILNQLQTRLGAYWRFLECK